MREGCLKRGERAKKLAKRAKNEYYSPSFCCCYLPGIHSHSGGFFSPREPSFGGEKSPVAAGKGMVIFYRNFKLVFFASGIVIYIVIPWLKFLDLCSTQSHPIQFRALLGEVQILLFNCAIYRWVIILK